MTDIEAVIRRLFEGRVENRGNRREFLFAILTAASLDDIDFHSIWDNNQQRAAWKGEWSTLLAQTAQSLKDEAGIQMRRLAAAQLRRVHQQECDSAYARGKTECVEEAARELDAAKAQILRLQRMVATMKPRVVLLAAFGLLVLVIAALTVFAIGVSHPTGSGVTTSVSVSVEYNVGDIILGVLGGAGTAAAGLAYAARTVRE